MKSAADIQAKASDAVFGRRLVTNSYRGVIAEAIVAAALEPDWAWCSADYASWDLDHPDGTRLEVKQSAVMQSWAKIGDRPTACKFDIRARTGRHEEDGWHASPGRSAHIYVFAHHFVHGDDADHRDPAQWKFFVLPTTILPDAATIGLRSIEALSSSCNFSELPNTVARTVATLRAA